MIVSGDKDQGGYDQTMREAPWVALPMGADKAGIEGKVPCTGYPTPGIINGATGEVINADAFGSVDDANYTQWMAKVWEYSKKKEKQGVKLIQSS